MKVLSLFDGISCARVALERAGIKVDLYSAIEIDKYAVQISNKNYPDTYRWDDVITYKGCDGIYDLLIGGSPCQDLSIAKKNRKGLDGERSGLFWEYVRILNEVKPKYFILENVNSMPKEAKDLITKTLGVEPIMINAALVSAQNRKRLFWVGKRVGLTVLEGQPYYEKVEIPQPEDRGILLKDILEDGVGVQLTERRTEEAKKMRSEYRKKYGSDYSPRRAKELVPRSDGKANTLTTMATKESLVYVGHINKTNGQANRVYSTEGKSVALSAMSGGLGAKTGMYLIGEKIRILTPIECERLQGLPDNFTQKELVLTKDVKFAATPSM
jgi:DNA (cytosine-5)-methyltransferase 3A